MRDKVPCRNVSTGYWFILWRAVSCKCCSQLRNVAIATARAVYASVRKQLCDSDSVAQIQHRMTPPGNSQMHHRPANTLVRTWMVRRGYLLKFGCIPGFSHPAKEACRQQTHAADCACSGTHLLPKLWDVLGSPSKCVLAAVPEVTIRHMP